MKKTNSLFNSLKGWPWQIFWRFNPVFQIIVILLALAIWAPDPSDILVLSFWGIVAGILFQKMIATGIVIGLGILFWIIAQIIESLIVIIVASYLIPAIVGTFCYILEADPLPILFRSKSRK